MEQSLKANFYNPINEQRHSREAGHQLVAARRCHAHQNGLTIIHGGSAASNLSQAIVLAIAGAHRAKVHRIVRVVIDQMAEASVTRAQELLTKSDRLVDGVMTVDTVANDAHLLISHRHKDIGGHQSHLGQADGDVFAVAGHFNNGNVVVQSIGVKQRTVLGFA